MSTAPHDDLLFGLLALQIGLIDQSQLVAAFQSWTLDRSRALADRLVERGALDADDRDAVAALVDRHLRRHGGDVERSLAAVPVGPSTRDRLARAGDPDTAATISRIGTAANEDTTDADRTSSYVIGTTVGEGPRYRVLRPHARGGLGAVFVAMDTELPREVALKQILDPHADEPDSRARFLLEAEVTGGLEHPGIVPVYSLGAHPDGRPYYAMRFIRGDSLKEAIERFHADEALRRDPGRRSLERLKLLRRFLDVCNAVDYAHARGVLHRDLKPGNIIVGKHGETLVVDWGLAKVTGVADVSAGERTLLPRSSGGSGSTLPGSVLGTPAYMSPEQAEGDMGRLGPPSDVYSLGATLYCLLTGRAPFSGDAAEVLEAVRRGAFPAPRQADGSIDPALEAICLKAMAMRPADRYPSCRALVEDIERWMADEPVTAWREPAAWRARRWMRRHRLTVTAAVVLLAAGAFGLGAVAIVQARANDALARANAATNDALDRTREAQAQTQRALAESESSREQAQAVSTFLVDAFRSPDPSRSRTGRETRVVDVLDRAVARLGRDFAGPSTIKGTLLDDLGMTYEGLGLYDQAVGLLERARAVREATLGPDHLDTLDTLNHLGLADYRAGRLREAVALLEATLARRLAQLGPDHPDTLHTRLNLANAYNVSGRLKEAIPHLEETLARRAATLGPEHLDTLRARYNLGLAYYSAGRLPEAIALLEAALKVQTATLGPDDLDTLKCRINLANAYYLAGRPLEAIALAEATIKLQSAKLGADHPDTLKSRSTLAVACFSAGRLDEAIAVGRETLAMQANKLGADHPDTLATRNNLANFYYSAGRPREAIPLHEGTIKLQAARLGPDHIDSFTTRFNLANAYRAVGRLPESIPLYEAALARYEAAMGPDHPDTLTVRDGLANAHFSAGRVKEAIALHRSTLAARSAGLGPDHPDTLASRENLARACWMAGRQSEALELFESTLAIREAKQGPDHPDTLGNRDALALAYESLGRWGEAEALYRRNLALRRKSVPPDSTLLADDLAALGRLLIERSRWPEAEPIARESLAIREKAEPDDWRRYDTMSLLGGAMLGRGRFGEAERLLVDGYEGLESRAARIYAPDRSRVLEAAGRVIRLYESWGKPERAAAWKSRLKMPDLPEDVFAAR